MNKIFVIGLFLIVTLCFAGSDFKNSDFTQIDIHADKASPQLKNSIPALVKYLINPASTDIKRVRAIFRWITQNIDYDIDAFFDERLRVEDPIKVIKKGKAVCGGYAILFKTMCYEAGIKSEVISGWSKGYGEQITMQANHAWNSVIINNRPYLLDVTWGAGYIDEQAQFRKSFNDHYFLTDPQQFIYDHLPEEDYWQLMKDTISRNTFKNLILLRPAFFRTGLELISHTNSTITVRDALLIKIQAPVNTYISASLLQNGNTLPENFHFIQKQKDAYELNVHFPDDGNYILRLFSKFGNDINESYEWACDYNIDVRRNTKSKPFTTRYAMFDDLNGYLVQPFVLNLEKGTKQNFNLTLENVLEVSILQNGKLTPLTKSANKYSGNVFLNADTVRVLARTDTTNYYHYVLEYFAK